MRQHSANACFLPLDLFSVVHRFIHSDSDCVDETMVWVAANECTLAVEEDSPKMPVDQRELSVALKDVMRASVWAVAWWKMACRGFSYLQGVCSLFLLLWPVFVFCMPYLSESFFFAVPPLDFCYRYYSTIYMLKFGLKHELCVWKPISLSAGCVNLVPSMIHAMMSHICQSTNVWHHIQLYIVQCKWLWCHTYLEVSMVKNMWCHICLNHRTIQMCMTWYEFALWLAPRAKNNKTTITAMMHTENRWLNYLTGTVFVHTVSNIECSSFY